MKYWKCSNGRLIYYLFFPSFISQFPNFLMYFISFYIWDPCIYISLYILWKPAIKTIIIIIIIDYYYYHHNYYRLLLLLSLLYYNKPALVQMMAWCQSCTSHYMNQRCSSLPNNKNRYMYVSHGPDELINSKQFMQDKWLIKNSFASHHLYSYFTLWKLLLL